MALKPCRECGRDVSTEAPACPHCGAPAVRDPARWGRWLRTDGEGADTKQRDLGRWRRRTVVVTLPVAFLLGFGAIPLATYGTISPCGILKKSFMRSAFAEELGGGSGDSWGKAGAAIGLAIGGTLVDRFVDTLSPMQCAMRWVALQLDEGNVSSSMNGGRASFGARSSQPEKPMWQASETRNPIDDTRTVYLELKASSGENQWGTPPALALRCLSNRTEVFIDWDTFVSSEVVSVTTRIDTQPAQRQAWTVSTDNKATFLRGSKIAFIKQLLAADSLVARVTPYGDNAITAVFEMAGLPGQIGPLREACNW
jgi:type VI secretion system VasI family protein